MELKDLLKEFDSELVGIGVLVDNVGVNNKRDMMNMFQLVELKHIEETDKLEVKPSKLMS